MIGITLHLLWKPQLLSVVFLSVMPNASVTLLKNALSESTAIKSHTIVLQKNGDKIKGILAGKATQQHFGLVILRTFWIVVIC